MLDERHIRHIGTHSAKPLTGQPVYAEAKSKYPQIVMVAVYNNVGKPG